MEDKQIKKVICTSSSKKYINEYIKYTNFFNRFDLIITGDEIVNGKPNPEIFIKAMEKMNVSEKETLIIEDSNNGIIAGVKSKADVIMVIDLLEPNEEVKSLDVKIFQNLNQVLKYIKKKNERESL